MSNERTIEIRISGQRGDQPLSPATVGVSYLIESLKYTRDMIAATESTDMEDPVVTISEGSLALRANLSEAEMTLLDTQLNLVATGSVLSHLPKKLRRALEGFQKLAQQNGDAVKVQHEARVLLQIDKDTTFKDSDAVWIHSEVYLRGKVNNAGGVSNPNLHVETDDPRFGKLLISATKDQLAADEKNRLYKPQTMRVEIMQDAVTGVFNKDSARLLGFVETPEVTDINVYLDELIGKAKGSWSDVKDSEKWLAQIRGYED